MKKLILLSAAVLILLLAAGCSGNSAREEEALINPGEWELDGTLTLPDGEGPFPLVVFVHGSGPADRDETIGRIKVFKDLAKYLQSAGIASLRYDKRTYKYGQTMAQNYNLTVYEETIEDALFAAGFAADDDRIDKNSIFLLGHSMGGYLIPRIDEADSKNLIAGYISLAGSVRSMNELLVDQINYMLELDQSLTEEQKAEYTKLIADSQKVYELTEADRGTDKVCLGAYATYWLDIKDYEPDKEITAVMEPLLLLQGGHDYQVTEKDFNLWKAALGNRKDASFIFYPELTHAFTRTEKMSVPNDYYTFANVDEKVGEDIAAFIKENTAG